MKTTQFLILALAASFAAHADFSYTQNRKSAQGAPAVTKYYFKGSRMLSDSGDTARLMDFSTQTITVINKTAKTYFVEKTGEKVPAAGNVAPQIDVRETGQKKTIGSYNCSQVMMEVSADAPAPAPAGMKMQVEMELWVSTDVPGWQSLRAFYQKNINMFAAMESGNTSMQKAVVDMMKKTVSIEGIPVLEVVRMKTAGGNSAQNAQMQAGMAQARARLEAMIQAGGQQAEMAKQALARMGGAAGGGASMFETTVEFSDFSTGELSDSIFSVPAGFTESGGRR